MVDFKALLRSKTLSDRVRSPFSNLSVTPESLDDSIIRDTAEVVPTYPAAVMIAERLFFEATNEWIVDDDQRTDWVALGLPVPDYYTSKVPSGKKTRQAFKDRQYMHRMGFASVRIAARGFIWLLNSTPKVSDINLSNDEKRGKAMDKLGDLANLCGSISVVYDVLLCIIEEALDRTNSLQRLYSI